MKSVCVSCFRNLGVESRIRIFMFLTQNDGSAAATIHKKGKNVTEITNFIGLKQPTVSYHLNEMLRSGLLNKQSIGKEVYYTVNNSCPHDGSICCITMPRTANVATVAK